MAIDEKIFGITPNVVMTVKSPGGANQESKRRKQKEDSSSLEKRETDSVILSSSSKDEEDFSVADKGKTEEARSGDPVETKGITIDIVIQ